MTVMSLIYTSTALKDAYFDGILWRTRRANEYYKYNRGKEFQIPSLGLCDLVNSDKSAWQTTLYMRISWTRARCSLIEVAYLHHYLQEIAHNYLWIHPPPEAYKFLPFFLTLLSTDTLNNAERSAMMIIIGNSTFNYNRNLRIFNESIKYRERDENSNIKFLLCL